MFLRGEVSVQQRHQVGSFLRQVLCQRRLGGVGVSRRALNGGAQPILRGLSPPRRRRGVVGSARLGGGGVFGVFGVGVGVVCVICRRRLHGFVESRGDAFRTGPARVARRATRARFVFSVWFARKTDDRRGTWCCDESLRGFGEKENEENHVQLFVRKGWFFVFL